MKLSGPQIKALRTIADNPGNVVAHRRGSAPKTFLKIHASTETTLHTMGLITLVQHTAAGQEDTTDTFKVWELTAPGTQELTARNAPAGPPPPLVTVPAELADRPMPKPVAAATLDEAKTVTPARLAGLTPPQIDALHVALDAEFNRLDLHIARTWELLYGSVRVDKRPVSTGRGYRQEYILTRDQLEDHARDLVAGRAEVSPALYRYDPMLNTEKGRAHYLAKIAGHLDTMTAHRADFAALADGPQQILRDEFGRRGGWSRFILCTNADGHIHNSWGCGTLQPTTPLVRLPELSGLTERDAVRAHGTVLCSHCFRSAPIAWTLGAAKPAKPGECSSSRKQADPKTYNPRRISRYAPCTNPDCAERPSVTTTGALRAHTFKPVTK